MNPSVCESMSVEAKEIVRVIESDPDRCAEIVRELLSVLTKEGWSEEDQFAIRMAIEEAVMNAIKHGNAEDVNKKVEVKIRIDAEHFYATVSDEGAGFSPEEVPDPSSESNLEKASGRGVKLMQTFVDHCRYNAAGNSVELIKRRSK